MTEADSVYVLDASGWLTLIEDEDGADTGHDLLARAESRDVVVLVFSASSL